MQLAAQVIRDKFAEPLWVLCLSGVLAQRRYTLKQAGLTAYPNS
jgi:hypothetical protein